MREVTLFTGNHCILNFYILWSVYCSRTPSISDLLNTEMKLTDVRVRLHLRNVRTVGRVEFIGQSNNSWACYYSRWMLDTSPTRHFAYWTLRHSVDSSPTQCEHKKMKMCDIHCVPKTRAQQLLRWATLATIDMGLKGGGMLCPFPGALGTRLIQCGLRRGLIRY